MKKLKLINEKLKLLEQDKLPIKRLLLDFLEYSMQFSPCEVPNENLIGHYTSNLKEKQFNLTPKINQIDLFVNTANN